MKRLRKDVFGVCAAALLVLLLAAQSSRPAPMAAQASAVVVTQQFGAALRVAPSSDAEVDYTASCGDIFPVVGSNSGWYEVSWHGSNLWVGGARVADLSSSTPYDCSDARTFQIGDGVTTYVATGCLSLRSTPSRDASYNYCVANGHTYEILDGPIEVSGEDWFQVWSASTGSGWSLAQYLY